MEFVGLCIDLIDRKARHRVKCKTKFNISPKTMWNKLLEAVTLLACRLFGWCQVCLSVGTKTEGLRGFPWALGPNTWILS
jgi:hypothetical protein